MKKQQIPLKNSLLLLLTATIWGVAFVAQSVGMDYVGGFTFNMARSLIGSAVLLPVIWFMGRNSSKKAEEAQGSGSRKDLLWGGLACGILMCLASNFQQFGIKYTTVGKAGFITACYIVLVPILGLFLKKKCSPFIWLAVAMSVAGLYLLCITDGFSIGKGDILVLICAACAVILCPKTEEAVGVFQGFSKETSGSEVKKWIPFIGGLFLLFFFSQILTSIFNVLVPIYAKQMGRLELASVFLMVVTAAMLVIRIGIPALLRKMGFRRFVMTGCILYVAGILCCLAAESVCTGIMMISGGILGGVASGIFMSVFHIKMLSVVPEELYGKVNIIFLLAIDFSLIVSGTFWSLLVNRFGLHEAFCLAAVMGLLPGLCCIVKPKSLCRSAE